jgi:hypothetical protein
MPLPNTDHLMRKENGKTDNCRNPVYHHKTFRHETEEK